MASVGFTLEKLPTHIVTKAKKELREDPKQIHAHLISFKRWISSMPHLQVDLDDIYLVGFLRHAKYEHSRAQARLDNFCTIRASPEQGIPHMFMPIDPTSQIVEDFFDSGVIVPLGATKDGVFVNLYRMGAWDVSKLPPETMRKISFCVLDKMLSNQQFQVCGAAVLMDMTDVTKAILSHAFDPKFAKWNAKMMQDCYPMRTKAMIFYNEPVIFDVVFKFLSVWINEKTKSRIMRVKQDLTKAYSKLPGLKEIMPLEYGGKNDNIATIIAREKAAFREFYSRGFPFARICVNEAERPESAKSFMREYKDVAGSANCLMGATGTFVKLESVDDY